MFDLTYFQPATDTSIPVTRPDIDYAALIVDLDDDGPNSAIGQAIVAEAGTARRAAPARVQPAPRSTPTQA